MQKNNVILKIFNIFGHFVRFVSLIIVSLFLYISFSHRMEYKPCQGEIKQVQFVECYTNEREVLKKDIDDLFGKPLYKIHYVNDLPSDILGQTNIFLRQVRINDELEEWKFVFTLAHELVHLTKFTGSERYCHLTAYNKLMASDCEYFKYVAKKWLNIDILRGVPEEYSFAGWVD